MEKMACRASPVTACWSTLQASSAAARRRACNVERRSWQQLACGGLRLCNAVGNLSATRGYSDGMLFRPGSAANQWWHHLKSLSGGGVQRRGLGVRAEGNGAADKSYDYDLFTIGAGSGGVRASRFSANMGAKVAVAELPFSPISSDELGGVGGTCVLRGCVPKKLLVYGSSFHHSFESSRGFGWSFDAEPQHDWPALIEAKRKELQRLTGVYKNLLAGSKVDLIEGRGTIVDPHTVEVAGKRYTAKVILVSTGGRATLPPIPGAELGITSDEALELPALPRKILIVGGGYIALEFACIFNNLGSDVHVFIRGSQILRGFDDEVRDFLSQQLKQSGITIHTDTSPLAVEEGPDGTVTMVTDKAGRQTADYVMFATGRKPNTKGLGLEGVGVKLDKAGAIVVDEYSRTSVPSIWAIGDVTNRLNLTPVALMEGMAFAKTVFDDSPSKPDHHNIASAVFTQPPIGTVGLSEAQAIKEFGDVDVFTSNFRPMKATLSGLQDRTFMKIIVDAASDRVVGIHIVGEEAGEITQGFAVAVKAGCTKAQFDATVGIHPTAAEELVTMRTPTRQIRQKAPSTSKEEAGVPV